MTDCVIGIDSSTQSTKAIAWDREGNLLGEGRAPVDMTSPAPDHFEQDPEGWWQSACAALRQLGRHADLSMARGLAISNQRETMGFLDAAGHSVRPAIVWLDGRAGIEAEGFSRAFGRDALLALTGKHDDLTPAVYKIAWMRAHEPQLLDRSARIVDVHGFLASRLTGTLATSWTSADPSGLFDIAGKRWSGEVLALLGLAADRLAPAHAPGTVLGRVSAAAAAATGLPEGLPVVAAGGDGQCAGLGVNAMQSGTCYLNLGTAIITGAWSASPRVGQHWRTMISPTGEGYFLEGVMRAGTFFADWFVKTFIDPEPTGATFDTLSRAAAVLPLGSEGVTVSPYLSGCMNPHWEGRARAAFFGLGPSHGKAHLYRALLEALTGEVARTIRAMGGEGVPIQRIVAVGGGANSALWRRMLADATGLDLAVSTSVEASSLGAAMTAAVAVGWYADFDSAAAAMSGTNPVEAPDPARRAAWDALLDRQDRINRFVCAEAAAAG
jgi:xylulokinase